MRLGMRRITVAASHRTRYEASMFLCSLYAVAPTDQPRRNNVYRRSVCYIQKGSISILYLNRGHRLKEVVPYTVHTKWCVVAGPGETAGSRLLRLRNDASRSCFPWLCAAQDGRYPPKIFDNVMTPSAIAFRSFSDT